MTRKSLDLSAALLLAALLAGCQSATTTAPEFTSFADTFAGLKTVANVEYYASDQAVAEAKNQFQQENYGNAGALFYRAVKLAPNDGEAWLGLAASCDRLHRFDLADKAYKKAYSLVGSTAAYYNNVGYSYLLQGNLKVARSNFLKAYELAPNDPTVANNLQLLASSVRDIQR
jgi:Flp pilus assembly protein TadD